LGEQHRLIVSPAMWREYFSQATGRCSGCERAAARHFHTDGYLLPIVPDLAKPEPT
jgi:hypothetical protein